ncbi:MAG: hypothetical protein J6K94_01765, partial [Ruminiclostridium sp.]|nr:hypothetical protein [Ruminiclostridium sp.]
MKIMIFKVFLRPSAARRPLACTFAGRGVFFPTHMSPEKTYSIHLRLLTQLCEALPIMDKKPPKRFFVLFNRI